MTESLRPPNFVGRRTMLRLPWQHDVTGVDVAIVGVPFDIATTGRPGARFGPAAIRSASLDIAELAHYPSGVDVLTQLNAVDAGDVEVDLHHPLTVPGQITARIAEILAAGCLPVTLGGDHFITYPVLEAVAAVHGPVALVHFDAHTDTWEPDGEDLNHGTMFTHALRRGLIDPARSIQVGIRTYNGDTRGITIVDAPWCRTHGSAAVADRILAHVGSGPAYLTFDIDGLDPAFAPGTGTPVCGGLTTGDAVDIIAALGSVDWVGMDLVEVSPPYDHADVTALAGATLVHEFLVLLAQAGANSASI